MSRSVESQPTKIDHTPSYSRLRGVSEKFKYAAAPLVMALGVTACSSAGGSETPPPSSETSISNETEDNLRLETFDDFSIERGNAETQKITAEELEALKNNPELAAKSIVAYYQDLVNDLGAKIKNNTPEDLDAATDEEREKFYNDPEYLTYDDPELSGDYSFGGKHDAKFSNLVALHNTALSDIEIIEIMPIDASDDPSVFNAETSRLAYQLANDEVNSIELDQRIIAAPAGSDTYSLTLGMPGENGNVAVFSEGSTEADNNTESTEGPTDTERPDNEIEKGDNYLPRELWDYVEVVDRYNVTVGPEQRIAWKHLGGPDENGLYEENVEVLLGHAATYPIGNFLNDTLELIRNGENITIDVGHILESAPDMQEFITGFLRDVQQSNADEDLKAYLVPPAESLKIDMKSNLPEEIDSLFKGGGIRPSSYSDMNTSVITILVANQKDEITGILSFKSSIGIGYATSNKGDVSSLSFSGILDARSDFEIIEMAW